MEDAARRLQGSHDFGGFVDHRVGRAVQQHGAEYTMRDLESIRVVRQGEEVLIWFVAKSFLRHQMRNIVSMLQMVGTGAWTVEDIEGLISRGFVHGRGHEGLRPESAPVQGLTLWEVSYLSGTFPPPVEYVDND